jgi:hypothetical protein
MWGEEVLRISVRRWGEEVLRTLMRIKRTGRCRKWGEKGERGGIEDIYEKSKRIGRFRREGGCGVRRYFVYTLGIHEEQKNWKV